MTLTFIQLLLPLGLLVVVSGLCFVGCVLSTEGAPISPPDFADYAESDVLLNMDCVAFWPLNEPASTIQPGGDRLAIDAKGKQLGNPHNGTYFDKSNPANMGQYPCPGYTDLGGMSAACSGALTLGATGIVAGDFVGGIQSTAMQTDGAYVEIAPNDVTTPANAFSVEAWINPGWDASDSGADHTFLDFRSSNASGTTGFALSVNGQGQLRGLVGLGAGGEIVVDGGQVTIGSTAYVVLTFDGTTATLFLDGTGSSSPPLAAGQAYAPNTTGRQVIGAGAPWLDNRTDPSAMSAFFPTFPFKGTIQDVAIYKVALDGGTINTHLQNGHGMLTDQQAG